MWAFKMGIIFYFFIFIFGLCIGSFLNSVIYRLKMGEGFFISRSYCLHCKTKLKLSDLIPLLSFFILKGKCRYCKKPISIQYPLVELITGILFVFVFYYLAPGTANQLLTTIYYLLIISFLLIIFVFDFKYYIIPDQIIYTTISITFLYNLIINYQLLITNYLVSAILSLSIFLAIFLLSQAKWLGFGDVKLAFFMGLFLGFPNILVALFLAFFIGAIISIGLILVKKKTLKSEIPFGPFLVTGTFLSLFFGEKIINLYLSLF